MSVRDSQSLIVIMALVLGCPAEPKSLGEECSLDSDCDQPLVCRIDRCRKECAVSRDCIGPADCLVDVNGLGACQLFDEIECMRDSDCPGELVCGAGRCTSGCRESRDCRGGAECEGLEGGPCTGEVCICIDRAVVECIYHGDCHVGQPRDERFACVQGTCRPECFSDRECPFGECLPLADTIAGVPAGAGYCEVPPQRAVYRVRVGGTGDGSSWGNAFGSLRDALAAAQGGFADVWVAAGRYTPGTTREDSFEVLGDVRVLGGFAGVEARPEDRPPIGEMETILSGDLNGDDPARGDNALHVMRIEGAGVVIERLTIEAGVADGAGIDSAGAGLLVRGVDARISDCIVRNNDAVGGGGLSNLNGATTLVERTRFEGNTASNGGGAVDNVQSSPRFVDCDFVDNAATRASGGAGAVNNIQEAAATFSRCRFDGNSAFRGGAMRIGAGDDDTASVTVVSSLFTNNDATIGGAFYVRNDGSSLSLANTVFSGNSATNPTAAGGAAGSGGAVFVTHDASLSISSSTVHGNTAEVAGAGVASLLDFVLAGVDSPGVVTAANSIFWANTVVGVSDESTQIAFDAAPTVDYCAVEGFATLGGTGNIGAGVTFVALDDLALAPGSAAIDAGNATLLPADSLDLDEDEDTDELLPLDLLRAPRQVDDPDVADTGVGTPALDLGAYERNP